MKKDRKAGNTEDRQERSPFALVNVDCRND
jgi:hypothetical protein